MENNPMSHEGMRGLQEARETEALADRLEQVTVRGACTSEDRAFIERCPMSFMASADRGGRPDYSYKGGLPGFVRLIDDRTLAFPEYGGNRMYRSRGNMLVNPQAGRLFRDFENLERLQVNGRVTVADAGPLRNEYPGQAFIVRAAAERICPNCPRYVHKMQLVEYSVARVRPRGRLSTPRNPGICAEAAEWPVRPCRSECFLDMSDVDTSDAMPDLRSRASDIRQQGEHLKQ